MFMVSNWTLPRRRMLLFWHASSIFCLWHQKRVQYSMMKCVFRFLARCFITCILESLLFFTFLFWSSFPHSIVCERFVLIFESFDLWNQGIMNRTKRHALDNIAYYSWTVDLFFHGNTRSILPLCNFNDVRRTSIRSCTNVHVRTKFKGELSLVGLLKDIFFNLTLDITSLDCILKLLHLL